MLIGLVTQVPMLWTLGFIAIVVGAVLTVASRAGHRVGGIAHWY